MELELDQTGVAFRLTPVVNVGNAGSIAIGERELERGGDSVGGKRVQQVCINALGQQ